MIRLIIFILFFAVFLCFIVLNLNNKSDVSLGFTSFNDVPVFLSALFSFTLGLIFSVPLAFSFSKKKKPKGQPEVPDVPKAKGPRLPFRKKSLKDNLKEKTPLNDGSALEQDHIKKEDSPYGID